MSKDWCKWQQSHSLDFLNLDKMSMLFPYLITYFYPPLTILNKNGNSLELSNGIDNLLFVEWMSYSNKNNNNKNNKNNNKDNNKNNNESNNNINNDEKICMVVHVWVYDRDIWLHAAGEEVYLCCQYSMMNGELISYINPLVSRVRTKMRKRYRIVSSGRGEEEIIGILSHTSLKSLSQRIIFCCDINYLRFFDVVDHDVGMLHSFSRKGIRSITCWNPSKNNGVFRYHDITKDDVFKPENTLVKALYNSILRIEVVKPEKDVYVFNNRLTNIFYLFDNIVGIDGKVVNPLEKNPEACAFLAKRRLRTSTLEMCVNELFSSLSLLP